MKFGDIFASASIQEYSKNDEETQKIRFDSSVQFLTQKENKQMSTKKLHYYVCEEVELPYKEKGKGIVRNKFKNQIVMNCEELATWDEMN